MSEKEVSKQVPLVIYKGGERIVVGMAIVNPDGSIQAQIAKDINKELKTALFGNAIGDISLNPMVRSPNG